jgi:O-antigen ligase
MKVSTLKYTVLSWVSGFTMVILFLMPFHALLTVWSSSLIGHYTGLRLWKEWLLLVCILGVLYLLATDHKIRSHTLSRRLVWTILAYVVLTVVWGLLALNQHDVSEKALGYGLISNLRFLAFFLVAWAVALRMARLRVHWHWLIIWPAVGVVIFGLLQALVLPDDFLRHFGYGEATIPAVETINNNPEYPRIASTLRGANPLGAYLIVPISLLAVQLLSPKRTWRQMLLMLGAVTVLFFSFSRSAWVGAILSVAVILLLSKLSAKAQKVSVAVFGILLIAGAGLTSSLRHNPHFQNFVFHTEDNSRVPTSSNGNRLIALKIGAEDVIDEPLGEGTGTAGPASFYNEDKPSRIAENYFLQIGQETGLIGLFLFVLINAGVGALLYVRRADPLALSLFASLIGLTFINMLSHAWTDDTLAYVWWGLAGVALAPLVKKPQDEQA